MLRDLLRRFWNRRRDRRRLALSLPVRSAGGSGDPLTGISEDVSDNGIRLRSEALGPRQLREQYDASEVAVELEKGAAPIRARAKLVWAYSDGSGGSVSGWHFVSFKGNARRRLRHFLDRCEAEMAFEQGE